MIMNMCYDDADDVNAAEVDVDVAGNSYIHYARYVSDDNDGDHNNNSNDDE